ncbi:MAG: hypothetical protein ABFS86_18515, partial [Planctomycetota bacterium]
VRVRFAVGYDADLDRVSDVTAKAIERTEGVLPDTADVVVRSLWDDARGHQAAGILVEGRYRIPDVRKRTKVRSQVLKNLHVDLREAGTPPPAPHVVIDGGAIDD